MLTTNHRPGPGRPITLRNSRVRTMNGAPLPEALTAYLEAESLVREHVSAETAKTYLDAYQAFRDALGAAAVRRVAEANRTGGTAAAEAAVIAIAGDPIDTQRVCVRLPGYLTGGVSDRVGSALSLPALGPTLGHDGKLSAAELAGITEPSREATEAMGTAVELLRADGNPDDEIRAALLAHVAGQIDGTDPRFRTALMASVAATLDEILSAPSSETPEV